MYYKYSALITITIASPKIKKKTNQNFKVANISILNGTIRLINIFGWNWYD